MSKSLKRVAAVLAASGMAHELREVGQARTAAEAAQAAGCALDQIVKSILFRGAASGHVVLFLTAGGNRVCPERASTVAGEALGKAEADLVRAETGFAIGGVSPLGHPQKLRLFWDPRLDDFPLVWAAAGTPRHVFSMAPADLRQLSGATPATFTQGAAGPLVPSM